MNESSVMLISFARLAGVYVVLLLRMRCLWWVITEDLRRRIAPWLSGGRSSYLTGTDFIVHGFELSIASFRIGAVMFSAETRKTSRRSARTKIRNVHSFQIPP